MAGKAQNVVWKRSLADLPIDRAVPIVDGAYMLAESVIWSSREQELWWVGEVLSPRRFWEEFQAGVFVIIQSTNQNSSSRVASKTGTAGSQGAFYRYRHSAEINDAEGSSFCFFVGRLFSFRFSFY